MPGSKLPILTITNKLYFRDDGLYIYSSTDGQLDITADTLINLASDTSLATGKYLKFSNDGVQASGGIVSGAIWTKSTASGCVAGWLKVKIGNIPGYIPVYSGARA